MKLHRAIPMLVLMIAALSVLAGIAGLTMRAGEGPRAFASIHGEIVQLTGRGLYKNDSVSIAAQGRASDFITLVIAVPVLLLSLLLARKGSVRGGFALSGILGYFLYTYMSYTFLWMYNPFFIVYVALMSLSFFAFILSLLSFDLGRVPLLFSPRLPVRLLGGFQLFIAFAIGLLWLAKIAPSLAGNKAPAGLEHYTTLVIQGMDLGFIVPAAALSGILLMQKKPFGYLLSSVIICKGVAMLTAICAMLANMLLSGVTVSPVEAVLFPAFLVAALLCLALLLRGIEKRELIQ